MSRRLTTKEQTERAIRRLRAMTPYDQSLVVGLIDQIVRVGPVKTPTTTRTEKAARS